MKPYSKLLTTAIFFLFVLIINAASAIAQDITTFRVHRQASDASVNWGSSNPSGVSYFLKIGRAHV